MKIEQKEMLRNSIPAEPEVGTRIGIRLPDGRRLVRKFVPTDSVQLLYDFVEAQDLAPLDVESDFSIFNTFPRKEVGPELTFKEAGLVNASVIVEEKIDE
jgi:UBX domain